MIEGKKPDQLVTKMLKESRDSNGHSLFEHLSVFLSQIPKDSKDSFELLSDFFKKHKFTPPNLKSADDISRLEAFVKQNNEWRIKSSSLIQETKTKKKRVFLFKPLAETAPLFQWVGVSLGKKETHSLDLSTRALASAVDAKQIRFWGKILTRKQDYFVVQGVSGKKNMTEVASNMQKSGNGVNQFTFWVTHNYLDQWYELPLVSPEQIQASASIQYIMSGDLNNQVKCYPPFPGQERHLLKTQLVRITHSCEVSPKGLYGPSTAENAAEDEIEFTQGFQYPAFADLGNLENWVHSNKHILKQGRTNHYVNQTLPQQEKEAQLAQMAQEDKRQERLRAISQDGARDEGEPEPHWFVRTYGDTQVFNDKGQEGTIQQTYAVVAIRSLLWPGWTTTSDKQSFSSVYIGYGLKQGQSILSPMAPNDLGDEGEDIEQYPQPNPKEPLDQLQPDSDDQNKKEDEDS